MPVPLKKNPRNRGVMTGSTGYPKKDRTGHFIVYIAGYAVRRVPGWEPELPLFEIENINWTWKRWYTEDGSPRQNPKFELEIPKDLAGKLIARFLYEETLELKRYGYS